MSKQELSQKDAQLQQITLDKNKLQR